MRIIVFGTGPFCVPSFRYLTASDHQIAAVVTRPIDDAGKRRKSAANPTRELAEKLNLPVLSPGNCNTDSFVATLRQYQADLFFVCDYGQILSRACLTSSRLGGINLHGSLLPKFRGAAPVQWAIYHGETETGVTVIHMTPKMDAGPCLAQRSTSIEEHETSSQLEPRLAEIGVDAVQQAVGMLQQWDGASPIGEVQDPAQATPAPRIQKSDGEIDFQRTARQIVNQIRAFQPWPNSFCHIQKGNQKIRLLIHKASTINIESNAPPGVVLVADKSLLAIQTGEQALAIEEIQPAGKKTMPITDFLRGNSIQVGEVIG